MAIRLQKDSFHQKAFLGLKISGRSQNWHGIAQDIPCETLKPYDQKILVTKFFMKFYDNDKEFDVIPKIRIKKEDPSDYIDIWFEPVTILKSGLDKWTEIFTTAKWTQKHVDLKSTCMFSMSIKTGSK